MISSGRSWYWRNRLRWRLRNESSELSQTEKVCSFPVPRGRVSALTCLYRSIPQSVRQHCKIRNDANRQRTRAAKLRLAEDTPSPSHRLDALPPTVYSPEPSSSPSQHFDRRRLLLDQLSDGRIEASSYAQGESGSVRPTFECSASESLHLAVGRLFRFTSARFPLAIGRLPRSGLDDSMDRIRKR